jgi:hypothetical protein
MRALLDVRSRSLRSVREFQDSRPRRSTRSEVNRLQRIGPMRTSGRRRGRRGGSVRRRSGGRSWAHPRGRLIPHQTGTEVEFLLHGVCSQAPGPSRLGLAGDCDRRRHGRRRLPSEARVRESSSATPTWNLFDSVPMIHRHVVSSTTTESSHSAGPNMNLNHRPRIGKSLRAPCWRCPCHKYDPPTTAGEADWRLQRTPGPLPRPHRRAHITHSVRP